MGHDVKQKIKNVTHKKDKHHKDKDVKVVKRHSKSRSHSRSSRSVSSKSSKSSRSRSPPKHVIEGHPTHKKGKDLEHEMKKLKEKMKHK